MNKLAGLRIAVIGRGIVGLSVAARLLGCGARPSLFGAAHGPDNASRCAQGVLANKGLIFAESPLFRAKLQSLRHTQTWLDGLERATGVRIPRQFTGVWEPYWSAADFQALSSRIFRRNFIGCYLAQNLAAAPHPAPTEAARSPAGVFFYPLDGWFDVQTTLHALETLCRRAACLISDEAVLSLAPSSAGLAIAGTSGLRYSFDRVIVAAGAGTIPLLQASGLEVPKHFLIGGQTLEIPVPEYSPIPRTQVRGTLSATWVDGRVLIGSSSWKGREIQADQLLEDGQQLLDGVEKQIGWNLKSWADGLEARRGTRLRFADRMPALGTWPTAPWRQTLWIATGFYKNGLHLADLCARDLVSLMEGARPDYPDFQLERLFQ